MNLQTKIFYKKFITYSIWKAKRWLKSKNIIVTKSNKGNVTVLIFREEYLQKLNGLLSDESTCQNLLRGYKEIVFPF